MVCWGPTMCHGIEYLVLSISFFPFYLFPLASFSSPCVNPYKDGYFCMVVKLTISCWLGGCKCGEENSHIKSPALGSLQRMHMWHFNLSAKTSEGDFLRTAPLVSSCHQHSSQRRIHRTWSQNVTKPIHLYCICMPSPSSTVWGLGCWACEQGPGTVSRFPVLATAFLAGLLLRQALLWDAEVSPGSGCVPASKCPSILTRQPACPTIGRSAAGLLHGVQ